MTHRSALPYARGSRRPTCDYRKVMEELDCSRTLAYELFHRGALQGFFAGSGRGLRFFLDSLEEYKKKQGEIHLI